ncbi:MAG: CYTH domain-containing protein [Anaerolineales bacterium]|nr:CYTH domain-containing protein [Anaerolineales bacterium]
MAAGKEIEAKFLIHHLADFRRRVIAEGGQRLEPRTLERNLRFDTQDKKLSASHQVLRLRQDVHTLLTYKYAHTTEERTEIEFEVNDFNAAKSLLEALGYQVVFIYEKYRETFTLDPTLIMLDELPFGFFIEIEGPSRESVHEMASTMNLMWKHRAKADYLTLFENLQARLKLPFRDATFANFADQSPIQPSDMGLVFASRPLPPPEDQP